MKNLFTYLFLTILGCFALSGQTTHFIPVWTGNGFMHMNFYIHERTINGTALNIGDEIAVFDGNYCVGTHVITSTTNLIAIQASLDDPITPAITDGFVNGHTPTFKIWLADSGTEITNIVVGVIGGSLSFSQLGQVEVSLHGTSSATNAPEISSITQPSCSVATGSVTLINLPSNGQWTLTMFPGGTETFSSSGTTYKVSNLSPRSYSFTVTDYLGLTSEQSSEITINPQPVIPSTPGDIDGNTTVCSGSSQNYSIDDVSGATDYFWSVPQGWTISGGQGSNSISVTASSMNGTISVTPSNECGQGNSASRTVTVNSSPEQPSSISGITSTCQGTSGLAYSVTAIEGISYTWTVPQGWNITGGQNSNVITVTAGNNSGSITVTPSNSCGNGPNRTLPVSVNSRPPQPAAISGNATICQGSEQPYSIVAVTGATSYSWTLPNGWSGSSSTNAITANAGPTDGTILVTANNSCGTSSPRTLIISVSPDPDAPTISMTQPTCSSPTGTITVTTPKETGMTYSINGSSYANSTGIFSSLVSGSYTVTAKNATGCISSGTSATIIKQPDTPSAPVVGAITQPTAEIPTGSVELNQLPNPDDWNITRYPDLIVIPGSGSNFIVEGLTTGVYTFTVTNRAGCTSEESDNVVINGVPSSINDNNEEAFSLFPNPTRSIVYLKPPRNHNDIILIEVIDMPGKVLQAKKINNPSGILEINLSDYSSGVYFINIVTKNNKLTYKIIRE